MESKIACNSQDNPVEKKRYTKPRLEKFGALRVLTQGGTGAQDEADFPPFTDCIGGSSQNTNFHSCN